MLIAGHDSAFLLVILLGLDMNESNFISNLSFVDKIFIKVNIFYLIL